MRKLDLQDGVEDGKLTRQTAKCLRCNRTLAARHDRCIYCGHERNRGSVFESV